MEDWRKFQKRKLRTMLESRRQQHNQDVAAAMVELNDIETNRLRPGMRLDHAQTAILKLQLRIMRMQLDAMLIEE